MSNLSKKLLNFGAKKKKSKNKTIKPKAILRVL